MTMATLFGNTASISTMLRTVVKNVHLFGHTTALMMNSIMKKATRPTSRMTSAGCGSVFSKRIIFGLLVRLKYRRGTFVGVRNGSQLPKIIDRMERSKAMAIQ